mmetsp:Transcript_6968/g.14046  ORF Transcript_6968/g.14046 Transcript_6968/m.14046 type:complete len:157 (-) Transcript_6968:789-1259(-)
MSTNSSPTKSLPKPVSNAPSNNTNPSSNPSTNHSTNHSTSSTSKITKLKEENKKLKSLIKLARTRIEEQEGKISNLENRLTTTVRKNSNSTSNNNNDSLSNQQGRSAGYRRVRVLREGKPGDWRYVDEGHSCNYSSPSSSSFYPPSSSAFPSASAS